MFKLQRHTRKKDQVVHIPEDPARDHSWSEDSDVLEDTLAAVDWDSIENYTKVSTAFKITEKKYQHAAKKLKELQKQISNDLILLRGLFEATMKRFTKIK